MPQFEVAVLQSQIVWLALVFGLLYMTLAFGYLPRLESIIKKRADTVSSDLSAAQSANMSAQSEREEYEAHLSSARLEVANLLKQTKSEAGMKSEKKLQEVDANLQGRFDQAIAALERARADALEEFDSFAVQSSSDIVERLLGRRPAVDLASKIVIGAANG